ncbi:MAG: sterol desaturase family protein [Actinobacteria bacterium]|nr:sterol desaturase family protein [Actinomycetota bacterium]
MPSAQLITSWLVEHAVELLAVSVASTVVSEHLVGVRRRRLDPSGSATSIVAGSAYLATKALVSKGLMFGVALAVYDHRLFDLEWTNPMVWVAVFVARDFQYYWIHRAEHRVRVLWASHMVHHSLERFTFTSAVRLPWMESVYKPALWLWVPLVGFHPGAFAAIGALVLAVGQLQHTELLRRRTPLDLLFVTPAAHRVHHGSNPEYLDRNFGSVLIVWDRLFGTYAAETRPVVYGLAGGTRVTTPAQALVGGFPALVSSTRAQRGVGARARHLLAAP